MGLEIYERAAMDYEVLAEQLEMAARHARTAAMHMRTGNVPRACAHSFAAQGNMKVAADKLSNLAVLHAEKSTVPG